MRTDTQTLIAAMRHLAATIQSDDGVANAAIAEAADRLAELANQKAAIVAELRRQKSLVEKLVDESRDPLSRWLAAGMSLGLARAIDVVETGGALPLEKNEKEVDS